MARHGDVTDSPPPSASTIGRLDSRNEYRLNGGFCDAAGDHVCASPGLARTVRVNHVRHQASGLIPAGASSNVAMPAAAGSKTEPESSARPQLSQSLHRGTAPCEPYAAAKAPRQIAGARKARINQRVQHETYLPTFRYPPQAYPWFPRAHEDPWRSCRDQRTPRQGPQAPGDLSAGRPARAVNVGLRDSRCLDESLPGQAPRTQDGREHCPSKPSLPLALPSVSNHAFPKAARLTKTDEFSSVFALRPRRRTTHFVLYVRANGQAQARLGIVVGKKFAPRAAERNLVKRMVRELFRSRQAQFAGRDILLRLQAKFPRAEFSSRVAIRKACHAEISGLLDVAAKPLPVAPAVPTAPPTASADVPTTPEAPA